MAFVGFGFLSQKYTVANNHFFYDDLLLKGSTAPFKKLLFKPYEKNEFLFCAKLTLFPLAILAAGILFTSILIQSLIILVAITAALFVAETAYNKISERSGTSKIADLAIENILQNAVGIISLPLSLPILATRSVASIFHSLS